MSFRIICNCSGLLENVLPNFKIPQAKNNDRMLNKSKVFKVSHAFCYWVPVCESTADIKQISQVKHKLRHPNMSSSSPLNNILYTFRINS